VTARLAAVGAAWTISVLVAGCASYRPRPPAPGGFMARAETKEDGPVRVSAAVPTAAESQEIFGVPLADKGIQPVWLLIQNRDQVRYFFLPIHMDENYFSPREAAWKSHFRFSSGANREMDDYFGEQGMPRWIEPGETASGFVFTNLDEGAKDVNVALLGNHRIREFGFFLLVPGIRADYQKVDWNALYSPDDIVAYDEEGLRAALERLPCCTTDKKGRKSGDPLNLVIIGDGMPTFHTFVRRGWDVTEDMNLGSIWKTVKSFLSGKRYRYSPVSPLYLFGRKHDIAFQKARETVNERNHLRLWVAPMRFRGKNVFVGQISRDIGVRFTTKTWNLTTHKIDPDVDEARVYVMEDLLKAERVSDLGFVAGVGAAPPAEPRRNLTGDPYFTDGFRGVVAVSEDPILPSQFRVLPWEQRE